jgi:mRNA interferase MazF
MRSLTLAAPKEKRPGNGRRAYVPRQGDLVWLDFSPQAGREQAGRRPAMVVSALSYNRKAGLALVCPITNQIKGYPFEELLRGRLAVSGAVLVDQVRSLDWNVRRARFIARTPRDVMDLVFAKLAALLQREE